MIRDPVVLRNTTPQAFAKGGQEEKFYISQKERMPLDIQDEVYDSTGNQNQVKNGCDIGQSESNVSLSSVGYIFIIRHFGPPFSFYI
ncbi:hypothetical protein AA14362_2639 [Acetobacter cerevisiae DSM 14362]|nr:hypothetical protein AA14362_2639 [Acetobacter cerevisiae DSM 14362]